MDENCERQQGNSFVENKKTKKNKKKKGGDSMAQSLSFDQPSVLR